MIQVTGQKEPLIKLIRDIQSPENRARFDCYFAEGEKLVRRAFKYGGTVKSLLLTDRYSCSAEGQQIADLAEAAGVDCYVCTAGLLSKVLDSKPVPECLVIMERTLLRLPEALSTGNFVFMIESCENADNLGMLLRCADAAGVDAVVLAGNCVEPFNRKTVRGSRGAVFTLKIAIEPDIFKVIEATRSAGYSIFSSSANTDTVYSNISMQGPTIIAVGNEHTGISDTLRQSSDSVVRIPMLGKINSLNIATAASVLLYEYIRQRACSI